MKPLPPHCELRPLLPADEPRLQTFFRSHTQETVYQRYGYHLASMSPGRARALLDLDQRLNAALGIFERRAGDTVLHAIGRYHAEPGDTAELAFVVRESHRRRGFATLLLHHLAETARRHGLVRFRAQVLCDNLPMYLLLEHYQPRPRSLTNAGAIEFLVPLENIPAPANAPAPASRP